ncbi:MAG: hypothetical protein KGS44_02575 [Alphaproteobacteria bacterium]|jgi:hypothetical protein|nr:hypothetical protein [Alphaproteobacteria bacterium]
MALRATLALFAAALTMIVMGPMALTFTDAALAGRQVGLLEILGLDPPTPLVLMAFAFGAAILIGSLALAAVWLPLHGLLDLTGLRGWGMYLALGYVAGGLVLAAGLGPLGLDRFPVLPLLLAGGATGAVSALIFWLVRRPDWI